MEIILIIHNLKIYIFLLQHLKNVKLFLIVACRIFIGLLLRIIGMFNIRQIFSSRNSGKKRIAFQAYSIHLAQFYQTIISELLKEDDKIEIVFIILTSPSFFTINQYLGT